MDPETPKSESKRGQLRLRKVLSKIAYTELPIIPPAFLTWSGAIFLFVLGFISGGFIIIITAGIGAVPVLIAGLVLSLFRNRYLNALGVGLLTPILLGFVLLFGFLFYKIALRFLQ
jgi:hypothetical protein